MILDERPVRTVMALPSAPAEAGRETPRWRPLAAVLALLPAAALAELLLIRTFYRVGIYIPKEGPFRAVYRILTAAGSFSFNLSSVLAALAVGALVAAAWRRGLRNVAVALGLFLVTALSAALSGSHDLGPTARLAFVLALAVVAWPYIRTCGAPWDRLAVAGVSAAVLLSVYAGLVGDAGRLLPAGDGPGGAVGAQLAGEALVMATAFVVLVAWARGDGFRWMPIVLGLFPAAALMVAWRANGAITGILVLWTAGLRLYLPVWLYALALWAVAAAAVGWLPRRPWRSAGLALLLAAGLLLESTYLQMLALLSVVLLTDGLAVGGLPSPPRSKGAGP